MAVRQYIGARYVPKFDGIHDINKSYEPLTIVTDAGATSSYTSKKYVPIGIELNNADYWALTGTLSGAVLDLQERVNDIEAHIDVEVDPIIERENANKIIFIADSYGLPEFGNWCVKTANILGLSSSDYYDLTVSGSNIARGEWLETLTTWANTHADEVNKIKYIVMGGGINDSDATNVPNLAVAIANLGNYIKTTFPYAEVKLFYFGWALDESPILAGRTANYRAVAQKLYNNAPANGIAYCSGVESVLHDKTLLASDMLHPNAQGGDAIACRVANAIKGGQNMTGLKYDYPTITPTSGAKNGNIIVELNNNELLFKFADFGISGSNFHMENNTPVKIADVILPYSNKMPTLTKRMLIETTEKGNIVLNCVITHSGNGLYMKIFDIDPSTGAFYDVHVTTIHTMNDTLVMNTITD